MASIPLAQGRARTSPRVTLPLFFFFNDTATTEIYTLSLHDALPIFPEVPLETGETSPAESSTQEAFGRALGALARLRSEEHTSELQSLAYLVCRLLLEKKKTRKLQAPDSVQGWHL